MSAHQSDEPMFSTEEIIGFINDDRQYQILGVINEAEGHRLPVHVIHAFIRMTGHGAGYRTVEQDLAALQHRGLLQAEASSANGSAACMKLTHAGIRAVADKTRSRLIAKMRQAWSTVQECLAQAEKQGLSIYPEWAALMTTEARSQ